MSPFKGIHIVKFLIHFCVVVFQLLKYFNLCNVVVSLLPLLCTPPPLVLRGFVKKVDFPVSLPPTKVIPILGDKDDKIV